MNKKLSASDIENMEGDSVVGALFDGSIELNNAFLKSFCSERFYNLMKAIPLRDRAYILDGIKEEHWFNGYPASNTSQDVWIDISEIEWQFDGDPCDVFEDPQDFTIHENLAYLYVGYGLSVEFDRDELDQALIDYLRDNPPA